MALASGMRLGPYEIVALIGAGGMGEVYRATDRDLGRQVAIKVLPDTFAHDPERLARFEREARTLASLNHPHVAHIYGLEKTSGVRALVMELVEGATLAERIADGPIPVDEALPIARQIAEALEAAHEQGVIHRDLKPANVKLRPDGTVKVLDFGLAKALDPTWSEATDATASPTITSPARMTGVGVVLGTAAYMSPEQARGKSVNKRADIWAFGCVVYEMLSGKRPFDGEDVSDTLANVLKVEPDWSALPPETSPAIRTLLHGCLTKEPRHRLADISTALFVLDKGAGLAFPVGPATTTTVRRRPLWRRVVPHMTVALVTSAVVGIGVHLATRSADPLPPRTSRFTIAPQGTAALSINGSNRDLAIMPDGSGVVYVGNRGTQLFVRALDAIEPVVVYTGAPRGPFVSPDGRWIGFMDVDRTLKRVAVTGGPAIVVATLDSSFLRGATWGPDDTIILATQDLTTGLQRVAAAGGSPVVLTQPDPARDEGDHLWPELLPGGSGVLFTIAAATGGPNAAQIAVLDLRTGTRTVLVRGGSHAHYVPGGTNWSGRSERESGHLVYAAAGTLQALPFDLASLKTRGTPVPVVPAVVTTPQGGVDAVVASDGTLAYISGGAVGAGAQRKLVWVDRQGHETPIPAPPRAYQYPRLSPDGTRIAVYTTDQEFDIWVWDLARTTLARLTFDPPQDAYPVWTPDSRRLIFSSDGNGARNLESRAADGTGAVERLTESRGFPTDLSPDGRWLVFTATGPATSDDVMQVELERPHGVKPLVQSSFVERNGVVSPDGRWLAYEANLSGRFEVFVRPFPEVNSGRWQVSTAGGTRPLWARSGQELFYVSSTGALMRVGVERRSSWEATTPAMLIKEGYYLVPDGAGRTYDIAPDGQRFLLIHQDSASDQADAAAQITVVQHWVEDLKRLVPVN